MKEKQGNKRTDMRVKRKEEKEYYKENISMEEKR